MLESVLGALDSKGGTSLVTLGTSGVLLIGYILLHLLPDSLAGIFCLVPGNTITRPWQVVTSGFFEDTFLNLVVAIALLWCASKLLRPGWGDCGGDHELLRFVVVVNALQGCLTWVNMIVLYILFRSEHFLFAQMGGATGLISGLSVAFRQYALQQGMSLPLYSSMAQSGSHHLPPLAVTFALLHAPTLAFVWSLLGLLILDSGPPDQILMAFNGALVAWGYLRYYQVRENGTAGDASAAFKFALLFPPPLHPLLRVLGHATFGVVSSCGCFPPPGWAEAAPGQSQPLQTSPALTSFETSEAGEALLGETLQAAPEAAVTTKDPKIAERRRERARALIEARLAAKAGAVPPAAAVDAAPEPQPRDASPPPP